MCLGEPAQGGAELLDVVAVHELVGVGVEEVCGRPQQHERDLVLAGDDADADAHRLERPSRDARIGADDDEHGLERRRCHVS